MTNTIKAILITILGFFFTTVNAQTLGEAVQYSFYDYIGTARTTGAGGSFGALGGDQGAIFINPASLAQFQKSEFTISPAFFNSSNKSTFAGETTRGITSSDFTAFNMGFVFASSRNSRSKWQSSNIAISYNKMTDFERNIRFEGVSPGTIVERFAERANGLGLQELDPFEAGVAYDSEAIFDFENDLNYEFDVLPEQEVQKMQNIITNGGMSELSLAWSGNYDGQFHLGFSLGIPFLRYESTKIYEEDATDIKSPFRNLSYTENLETSGSGINIKAGLIYTGIKGLRLGASIASPTNFSLDDEFSTSMTYSYVDSQGNPAGQPANSGIGQFDYDFITPWRTTGSIAYLLNTSGIKGFLSFEVDYLNYRSARFDLTSESNNPSDIILQEDLNEQIDIELKSGLNYRIGAEFAYNILRLRAGYGLNGSPYFNDDVFFSSVSLGGGLRFDKFFVDVAFRNSSFQQGYLPYVSLNPDNIQLVQLNTSNTYINTTFGIKF